MKGWRFGVCVVALAVCAGCDSPKVSWDWSRMLSQPHYKPYTRSDLFADGRAMRTPPRGAIARDAVVGEPLYTKGVDDGGRYADEIPMPVDAALLDQGQAHFDTFCAPCHGVLGDGRSIVGDRMELRRPPSIIDEEARALPPGRIMEVVSDGYGFMRSYAADLSTRERWAVVAYLEALQLSQGGVTLDELPARERAEAESKLP